jgi:hypothetical protein
VIFFVPGAARALAPGAGDVAVRGLVHGGSNLITRLTLNGCPDITAAGLGQLVHFTGVRELDLSCNWAEGMGVQRAKELAKAVHACRFLSALNVSNNNMRATEACHVAKAVQAHPNIFALDISKNELGRLPDGHLTNVAGDAFAK